MALAYQPPGVSANEVITPNVSPLLASPANVAVVGKAIGFRTRIDQIRLTDTADEPDAVALTGLPEGAVLQEVISVKDALDPSKGDVSGGGYVVDDDYIVDEEDGTIARVDGGDIEVNTIVNIYYQYLPVEYFVATRMNEFSTVEAWYGSAYSTDGNSINSPLSYAALLAFENGAAEVVCQPLFERVSAGNPSSARRQPISDAAAAAVTTWQDTLYALRDIEDINVIVPIVGQSQTSVTDAAQLSILKAFQDHIQYMKTNDQYIIGVFGEDSSISSTVATQATLKAHFADIQGRYAGDTNQQLVFIEPSRFGRISPITGTRLAVGGQYVAAAYAGMLAARPVSASLTRKQISGISEVLVPRLKLDKNDMAQAGFTVVEQRGSAVRVRHAITGDATTTATRELSIVRAKHRMIESVRDTLENQVIGEVIADDAAPLVVRGAVIAVLERLRNEGDLVAYRNVDARMLTLDPTTVEVRFSYRPAFPVNYVNIVFSIDLTDGTATVTGT